MESKRGLLHLGIAILASIGLFLILWSGSTSGARYDGSEQLLPSYPNSAAGGGCRSENEVAEAVNNLLIKSAADHAQLLLVNDAKKSTECRKRVVKELISMMSKHTKIGSDAPSYSAWRRGSEVMANLKPYEALDFFISNLTLNDYDATTGFAPSHLPAANSVIKIGSIAIPKLNSALRNSTDRRTRLFAVYCIGSIGGRSALLALKNALPMESDPRVNKFIQLTIDAFQNTKLPNHIISKDHTKWLLAFYADK